MFLRFILLFGFPLLLYLAYRGWKVLKVKRLLKWAEQEPFPEHYEVFLQKFLPYKYLSSVEKSRFKMKVMYFLRDKIFTGIEGLEVTEEMRLLVAAEACLMITNIEGDIYPGLKNIYLAPDVFVPRDNPVSLATGLPTHSARLGEAWKDGPIVLSWGSIAKGSSVVFHEFSHQLDQQDGSFDGTPELGKNGNYDKWASVLGKEFLELRKRIEKHKSSDIDTYGATNEAEFFAVVTEYFFTNPWSLNQRHPAIYEVFRDYFRLDPINWKN